MNKDIKKLQEELDILLKITEKMDERIDLLNARIKILEKAVFRRD